MSMFRTMAVGVGIVLGSALSAPAGAPRPEETAALVDRLLAVDPQQPMADVPDPAQPYPTERQFLFDAVRDVSPESLLAAVRFAVNSTPIPETPDDRAAYERALREKLVRLLEYYPLAATTTQDFRRLVDIIRSGANPPMVRAYLLRQAAPGLGARTALGEYMQAMATLDDETFAQQIADLIRNVTEPPAVQEAAIATMAARIAHGYDQLLNDDPLVRTHAERTGVAAEARALIDAPDALPMSRRTQMLLERMNQSAGTFAALFVTALRDPGRADAVRDTARAAATDLAQHYPLANRQELLAELEATP